MWVLMICACLEGHMTKISRCKVEPKEEETDIYKAL